MPQRSIRFPDDVHAALEGEALRLERSFSWVVVKACELALRAQGAMIAQSERDWGACPPRTAAEAQQLYEKALAYLAATESDLPKGTKLVADTTPILKHRPNCRCPVCRPAKR